jgi:hypothetical protein
VSSVFIQNTTLVDGVYLNTYIISFNFLNNPMTQILVSHLLWKKLKFTVLEDRYLIPGPMILSIRASAIYTIMSVLKEEQKQVQDLVVSDQVSI